MVRYRSVTWDAFIMETEKIVYGTALSRAIPLSGKEACVPYWFTEIKPIKRVNGLKSVVPLLPSGVDWIDVDSCPCICNP